MSRRNTLIKLLNKERTYNEEICCGLAFDRWVNDSDLAIIVDALEKTEKYKWHDLRKNPDDLPKKDENIIAKVYFKNGLKSIFIVCKGTCWGIEYGDVIAWKYIEPFEEVENDL